MVLADSYPACSKCSIKVSHCTWGGQESPIPQEAQRSQREGGVWSLQRAGKEVEVVVETWPPVGCTHLLTWPKARQVRRPKGSDGAPPSPGGTGVLTSGCAL